MVRCLNHTACYWSDCISKITRIETSCAKRNIWKEKGSDCISKITRIETFFPRNDHSFGHGGSDCISKITRIETVSADGTHPSRNQAIWLYFQDNKDWNDIELKKSLSNIEIWLYFQDNKDWNNGRQNINHGQENSRSDCISKITRIETFTGRIQYYSWYRDLIVFPR